MKVYVILYKDKFEKGNYAIYDICASNEIASNRLEEIKKEESSKLFKIEDWNVKE